MTDGAAITTRGNDRSPDSSVRDSVATPGPVQRGIDPSADWSPLNMSRNQLNAMGDTSADATLDPLRACWIKRKNAPAHSVFAAGINAQKLDHKEWV